MFPSPSASLARFPWDQQQGIHSREQGISFAEQVSHIERGRIRGATSHPKIGGPGEWRSSNNQIMGISCT